MARWTPFVCVLRGLATSIHSAHAAVAWRRISDRTRISPTLTTRTCAAHCQTQRVEKRMTEGLKHQPV